MKFLFLLLSVTVLFSCQYNKISGGTSAEPISFGADTTIDFQILKTSSLRTCSSCHASQKAPQFNDLASTQQNLQKIVASINAGKMPPVDQGYAALSACEIALVNKWASIGAPDQSNTRVNELPECQGQGGNGGGITPVKPISEMPLVYNTVLTEVLQKKCMVCHNPQGDDFDATQYLFFPYAEINNNIKWWQGPGDRSKIIRIMARGDMPPADSGVPAVTPEELDFIVNWIDAGRPE